MTTALDVVTGGAGFIGSHLVERLLGDGRAVRVIDNFWTGRRANLQQHAGNPRLKLVEGDVVDADPQLHHGRRPQDPPGAWLASQGFH